MANFKLTIGDPKTGKCYQKEVKDAEAGHIIGKEPTALHLRLFQTMSDIAVEKNSTIILPIPTELLEYLGKSKK